MNTASRSDKQRHRVIIVGGGAGGLELATRFGDDASLTADRDGT